MDNASLLVVAMADQCRSQIQDFNGPFRPLPSPLHVKHLKWMCDEIEQHAEDWPATKLHRWIGFLQCAMIAHHMLELDEARAMFDRAKVAHGDIGEDLVDHLDSTSSFQVDIGGEG